ncbi:MAG: dockerin type I domain-containing protein [Planctomycetota bacterium]
MRDFVFILSVCLIAVDAAAGLSIAVDTAEVPAAADAQLSVIVSGGDDFTDLQFVVLIEDGGVELGGVATGPAVTAVDFSTGILAAGTATDAGSVPLSPFFQIDGVPQQPGDGLVAVLTLDTSALNIGDTFDLTFGDGVFDTFFALDGAPVPSAFTAPTITIVADTLPGDFDNDGDVDADDINLLFDNLGNPAFDLTNDGIADDADLDEFITNILGTFRGDANLDGEVSTPDLAILAANFSQPVIGWAEADFNGDGSVNTGDLAILASNFGLGTSPYVAASIPEPSIALAALLAPLGLARRWRHHPPHFAGLPA